MVSDYGVTTQTLLTLERKIVASTLNVFFLRILLLPRWNSRESFQFRNMFFQVGFLFLGTAAFYFTGMVLFQPGPWSHISISWNLRVESQGSRAWWAGLFLESHQGWWKVREYFRSRKSLETSIMPYDLRKRSQMVYQNIWHNCFLGHTQDKSLCQRKPKRWW